MDKFHIELYPKADLENEWAKNKHTPGPCMRCGGPMWESLAENALSRALNVYFPVERTFPLLLGIAGSSIY